MSDQPLEGARHDVVVVGGGQAGLALSWHLVDAGVDHVVLERETAVHDWVDRRWDAFTLVTPNWQCRLPGYGYDGPDPDGFMTRDEVHAWLRAYPATFGAPLHEGVEVLRLREHPGGGFEVTTSAGTLRAGQVVVATGGYHRPVLPPVAQRLPDDVVQLHSADYRSPEALPAGAVLVVGSGQSGAQVAEDLLLAGRQVHLSLGSAPRVARRYRGRDCVAWLADMGVYDAGVGTTAGGLAKRESTNHYVTGRDGGRDIDLRAHARDRGLRLHGRLTAVERAVDTGDVAPGTGQDVRASGTGTVLRFAPSAEASLDAADAVAESIKDDIDAWVERQGLDAPTEARYEPVWRPEVEDVELDLRAEGVSAVVWATGFRSDYRWVGVGVFDGAGAPTHVRGVTTTPGLYFLGLPWLHTWGSGRFAGIARDAEHLADAVVRHLRTTEGPADGAAAQRTSTPVPADHQSDHQAEPPDLPAQPGPADVPVLAGERRATR
ncbi:NAD(P)-binding domain-containing protein [Pseudokineococcus sp. 1T1Z-3]|uniref:NAD(P)-binding domain-containing protein n=1 Tax=Pseudokineococcus sp. 1T1Z-3 TaxID=3132745 RepID=UPI00309CA9FF